MPNHERDCRPLLFRERQELRREIAKRVAIECRKARDTDAIEDREQQQRIFGRLSQRFSSLDQQTCLLRGRLGFGGGIAFDMDEWGYERDLKLDLLATQGGRAGQGSNLGKRAAKVRCSLYQRRALKRALPRFSPQPGGLLDQAGLGAVMCQQLRLALGDLGRLVFKGFGDTGVKRATRL